MLDGLKKLLNKNRTALGSKSTNTGGMFNLRLETRFGSKSSLTNINLVTGVNKKFSPQFYGLYEVIIEYKLRLLHTC